MINNLEPLNDMAKYKTSLCERGGVIITLCVIDLLSRVVATDKHF